MSQEKWKDLRPVAAPINNQSAAKRLILWDIDETMISSDGAGFRSISRAMDQMFGINREACRIPMSGKTDPQIITEILTAQGHSRETAEKYVPEVIATYLTYLDEEIAAAQYYIVHEGVRELLDELSNMSNAYQGLLTGNVEHGAGKKLSRFQLMNYFAIGAYGSDSASRLDLPAIAVQRAVEHFRIEFTPQEVVIIGDSVNDIACARVYGAKAIAVNTGKTSYEILKQEKPCHLFKNLSDTKAVLAAIFN